MKKIKRILAVLTVTSILALTASAGQSPIPGYIEPTCSGGQSPIPGVICSASNASADDNSMMSIVLDLFGHLLVF